MMKISSLRFYCVFGLVLLLASSAFGQGYDTTKWRFSNPQKFGFTTVDVDFFDNNVGIAVGFEAIARTTDGGKNWTYGAFTFINQAGMPARASFNDVHFVTSSTAYATANSGVMVKTTDAGLTWNLVTTPLTANAKNINTVWFVTQDIGYIGGQWNNTVDSIPKIYRTINGGATWDSLAAPGVSGTTKVGFINNATYPGVDRPITGKTKEIWRIMFLNSSVGYISGGGASDFPDIGIPNITNTTTCAFAGSQTTGSHNATLLWKFDNGALTDYSLSKERLGYTGYPATLNCTSKYGSVTHTAQQYRALNIINDSTVVMLSFNNNIVIKINTGKNDSTQNINRPGVYEKGRYEVLNTGNSGPPPGYPPIPAVQVLAASNPYHLVRSASGKLHANAGGGLMFTSVDTGRNWVRAFSLPQGQNFSASNTLALDILPSGKFVTMGAGGVLADSIPGAPSWQTTYTRVPVGGTEMEFVDCANGIGAGGAAITVTTDGGATWVDKTRTDLGPGVSINGMAYPNVNRAWFAISNGIIYTSPDKGTTLDPSYSDFSYQMHDVVGIGNDTVYAVGYTPNPTPVNNRKSTLFRSFNGGTTWTTVDIAVTTTTPAFTAPTLSQMAFPSRNIGYVAGNRNAVYKTTDGGSTWTDISPFPSLNFGPAGFPSAMVTYTEVFALNDNTVFLVGNMFTNVAVKRVYKTTDGGATWVDITGNIPALFTGGFNGAGVLFHDANNGYVCIGGQIFKTTDGGTNWSTDISPTPNGTGFTAMAFSPRSVPASISFANHKLFIPTGLVTNGTASILEYGRGVDVNVNAATTVVNTNCANASGGSITVTATGGIAPYTYNINGGTFQASNVFNGLTQGVKTIQVKDAFCGITTIPVTITFTDNLTLTANNDTSVCAGAPVPLLATSIAGATFAWTPVAGLSSATIANPVATVSSPTTYTVTATLGTCVKTEPVVISIKPNPVVSAGTDKTILAGDQVTLNGTASGATNISWTPAASLTNANTLTPIAKPATTTTYTLSVRNADNCTSTDDAVVIVIPVCVKVMNAFTPNGDGINDLWKVTDGGSCTSQVQVAVYNRYGNEVYKNANYNNDWNGQYNSKPLADGTYYYKVTLRFINGTTTSLTGDVTILR
jgi:gliding motility-associated-like protein